MMRMFATTRRVALTAALSLGLAACSTTDAHEVEVDLMRITVGGQVVMVNSTGAVTGGPISLVNGVAENVTVEFLDAAMADALAPHASDFQANVTTPGGVTFARTGPFAGTLTGTAIGTSNTSFALFHIEEGHEDFGPFNVSVTVVAAPIIAN
jgi:hypothetical protein